MSPPAAGIAQIAEIPPDFHMAQPAVELANPRRRSAALNKGASHDYLGRYRSAATRGIRAPDAVGDPAWRKDQVGHHQHRYGGQARSNADIPRRTQRAV